MNFIALTDRFARQIEAWKQGYGFSDLEALKDLMEIWHKFINLPERKAVSYPGSGGEIPLVDYKCGKCGPLSDALQLIYSWRQHLVNEVTVDFVDVPKAEVVTITESQIVEAHKNAINAKPTRDESMFTSFDRTIESVRAELDAHNPPIKWHHKMKLPKLIKLLEDNG